MKFLQINKSIRLFGILLLITGLSFYVLSGQKENKKVTILQTTDIHSNIKNSKGGFLKLIKGIKNIEERNGGSKDCLLIDCGDLFQGTYEAAVAKGEIIPPFFNLIKYDAFIPGNHDFDFGKEQFLKLSKELNCDILAANLKLADSNIKILPWKTYLKNNKKITVIGMTNSNIDTWLWGKRYDGIKVDSLNQTLKKVFPKVLAENPDLIILAVHQGLYQSRRYLKNNLIDIAKKFPQIDIILGGHSHEVVDCKIIGRNTVFVQAGSKGQEIARIDVDFSNNEKIITSKILNIKSSKPLYVNSELYNKFSIISKTKYKKLNHSVRLSNSAEFIAKIMQETANADFALCNISKDKNKFSIKTANDVFKLIPYEDNIVKIFITGSEFNKIIKEQETYYLENPKYQIYAFSGLQKILTKNAVKSDEIYSLAVSSYDLAGSGNRFPYLKKIGKRTDIKKTDTGILIREAVVNYLNRK